MGKTPQQKSKVNKVNILYSDKSSRFFKAL